MARSIHIDSTSADQTERIGAAIAIALEPGDVVLVAGDLGAGKTTLVRGACDQLGVSGPVTSPTFVIGQVYAGKTPVAHVDLYRLDGLAREDPALLDDYLTPSTIAFVEWPDLADRKLPVERSTTRISLAHAGRDARAIDVRGSDRVLAALADAGFK